MQFEHIDLVFYAKTHGLLYLIACCVVVLIYVYRPSNKKKFDKAAKSILDDKDSPCQ